jgi:membrane-associated PAP2 superfamily phosphatase
LVYLLLNIKNILEKTLKFLIIQIGLIIFKILKLVRKNWRLTFRDNSSEFNFLSALKETLISRTNSVLDLSLYSSILN